MTLPRSSDHSLMNRRELDHLGVAAARSGHTSTLYWQAAPTAGITAILAHG